MNRIIRYWVVIISVLYFFNANAASISLGNCPHNQEEALTALSKITHTHRSAWTARVTGREVQWNPLKGIYGGNQVISSASPYSYRCSKKGEMMYYQLICKATLGPSDATIYECDTSTTIKH